MEVRICDRKPLPMYCMWQTHRLSSFIYVLGAGCEVRQSRQIQELDSIYTSACVFTFILRSCPGHLYHHQHPILKQ